MCECEGIERRKDIMIHSGVSRLLGMGAAIVLSIAAPAAPSGPFHGGGAQSRSDAPVRFAPVATPPEARDPSLTAFLDRLREIARTRDTKALLAVLVDNIGVGWKGEKGKRAFTKEHELSNPKSRFWHDVETLIDASGPYVEWGGYYLPHVFMKLPQDASALDAIILTGNEPVRAEPSAESKVLTTVSHEAVVHDTSFERDYDRHPDDFGPYGAPWVKIALPDGRKGYVRQESVWSVAGPRFSIQKIDGKWRITEYTVGD
jgi:hypothetical protein